MEESHLVYASRAFHVLVGAGLFLLVYGVLAL